MLNVKAVNVVSGQKVVLDEWGDIDPDSFNYSQNYVRFKTSDGKEIKIIGLFQVTVLVTEK